MRRVLAHPTLLVFFLFVFTRTDAVGGQAVSTDAHPSPVFLNPGRVEALATAARRLEPLMEDHRRRMGAPGLAWGVLVDGEIVAEGALGAARADADLLVTPHTVFRIASMTKSVTALAVLALRDAGRLSLDEPVSKYVPAFGAVRLPTSDSPPITIRHLLTHGAGFPEDNPWGDRQLDVPLATLEGWLRSGIPFSTPPATAYEYSNYGFALLGRVVAAAAGTSYREYVNATLLRPLGMTSTFWDARDVPDGRLAAGYRRGQSGLEPEPPLGHGAFGPMGGLFTSGRDLARWVSLMLSAWPPRDGPETGPVRRSTLREMQQFWRPSGFQVGRQAPDAPVQASSAAYGYGLRVTRECDLAHTVGHGGGLPGYGSYMLWLPEHGVGVYVLANITYAPAGGAARAMVSVLAESGALEPRRLPASPALLDARRDITALVNGWSDDAAHALAADNLFQDRPLSERRAEAVALASSLGHCRPEGDIDAENWLRGTFRLSCGRGWLDVAFTLSPTVPPKVQALTFTEGRPLDPDLRALVDGLYGLIGRWDRGRAEALVAREAALDELHRRLKAVQMHYGRCRAPEVASGDGRTRARLRLACDRGPLELAVTRTADGRLGRIDLQPPRGVACVP